MKSFNSIGEFCDYLRTIEASALVTMGRGVRDAGEIVFEEAREEIGHYQEAAGPFPAWAPLAETTLNGFTDQHHVHHPGKIELGFAPPDNPLLRTGELRDAIELATTAIEAVVGVPSRMVGDGSDGDPFRDIGDVAVMLENGTSKMPARSFLGRAGFVKCHEVIEIIGYAAACAIAGVPYHRPAMRQTDAVGDILF